MTKDITAQSAEPKTINNAVEALCSVVQRGMNPMWIISDRSGLDPIALAKFTKQITITARTPEAIRTVESRVSGTALNASIIALSRFVEALCADDEND